MIERHCKRASPRDRRYRDGQLRLKVPPWRWASCSAALSSPSKSDLKRIIHYSRLHGICSKMKKLRTTPTGMIQMRGDGSLTSMKEIVRYIHYLLRVPTWPSHSSVDNKDRSETRQNSHLSKVFTTSERRGNPNRQNS